MVKDVIEEDIFDDEHEHDVFLSQSKAHSKLNFLKKTKSWETLDLWNNSH